MINYQNIQQSIDFYQQNGFQRIETPWTVTPYISSLTRPHDCTDYEIKHNKKVLVASGEQSFLYLYLKDFLPKGKFQSVTPCFRHEIFDLTHTKYFLKNELIITDNVNEQELQAVINVAKKFFVTMLGPTKGKNLNIIQTTDSYDIEYKGIELGSYGIRQCPFLNWIYATGCAEPRLSTCQNL
jgi:hypothetical protein